MVNEEQKGDLIPAPSLRVTRPSLSSEAESITAAADDDFARLAKARSNPDILRSTIDDHDIRGVV